MITLLIAVVFLLCVLIAMVGWVAYGLGKLRLDQLVIRTFIAHEIRAKRGDKGLPVDDEAFFRYLRDNPDRPHKDDPPLGGRR